MTETSENHYFLPFFFLILWSGTTNIGSPPEVKELPLILRILLCNDCGASFETQINLEEHGKIYHNDQKRTCKLCQKEGVGQKNILNHMRTHKESNCKWCWKKLLKASEAKHKETCKDNPQQVQYSCSECIFATNKKSVLKIHMNIHQAEFKVKQVKETPVETFKCKFCVKT